MATLTIRDLDDDIHARLRVRAARNGRSMEAEVRDILRSATSASLPEFGLGTLIHELFSDVATELELPPRADFPRSLDLS